MGHMGSVCTRGWGSVGQLVGRSVGDDGFLDSGPGGRGWGAEGVGVRRGPADGKGAAEAGEEVIASAVNSEDHCVLGKRDRY